MAGVIRSIDQTGRLSVPREFLRTLSWQLGDPVLIESDVVDGQGIIRLSRPNTVCSLCGGSLHDTKYTVYFQKPICDTCIHRLTAIKEGV